MQINYLRKDLQIVGKEFRRQSTISDLRGRVFLDPLDTIHRSFRID